VTTAPVPPAQPTAKRNKTRTKITTTTTQPTRGQQKKQKKKKNTTILTTKKKDKNETNDNCSRKNKNNANKYPVLQVISDAEKRRTRRKRRIPTNSVAD
jgi:hypothetical protein